MRLWMAGVMFGLCGLSCDDSSPKGPPRSVPMPGGNGGAAAGGAGGGAGGAPMEPEAPEPGTLTFLESLSDQVITPLYSTLQTDATALKAALDGWLAAPDDAAALEAAQAAYQTFMDGWQRADVIQVGPAAAGSRPGGMRLRERIYSWPQVNPCRVDQEVGKGTTEAEDLGATRLVNVFGLDALEYLLFHAGDRNQCPLQVPPNSDGAWSDIGADGLPKARATYAVAVGAQIVRDVSTLNAEWATYKTQLISAGDGSTLYASRQEAYNDVFAGIFYLDLMVKDAKIGDVVGITAGCAAERCPENAESAWLGRDARNILENLRGAEAVLFGADAEGSRGFVGLLEDRGADDLVADMRAAMDGALAAVEALQTPFSELATTDPAQLESAYADIKVLTDLLKTQFVTTLNLSVPAEGSSDTD